MRCKPEWILVRALRVPRRIELRPRLDMDLIVIIPLIQPRKWNGKLKNRVLFQLSTILILLFVTDTFVQLLRALVVILTFDLVK